MFSRITIIILCLLLVASNIFWLYSAIDSGVTRAYMGQQIYEADNSSDQAVGMLKKLLTGKTKSEVQALAQEFSDIESFEKEGCLWIGWYGFKFSDTDTLIDIEPKPGYSENSVCNSEL